MSEKREGCLSSPPPPAPYFVHSLAVLFVLRAFLQAPTTQTRNNRELKLTKRRTTATYSWTSSVFLEEKEENARITWRLSLRRALLIPQRQSFTNLFYSSVLSDLTFG